MAEKTLPATGGCLCGAVRYESREPPRNVGACHCRMCQKSAGGVNMIWAFFPKEGFRFTTGEPRYFKSSDRAERGFCATCGTPLVYRDASDVMSVPIGTLDHPEEWPPDFPHNGMESKVPWEVISDDLPRFTTESAPAP